MVGAMDRREFLTPHVRNQLIERFPVQVSKWARARDEVEFMINQFQSQGVACCIRKRESDGRWTVWREWLDTDTEDQLQPDPAVLRKWMKDSTMVEIYLNDGWKG